MEKEITWISQRDMTERLRAAFEGAFKEVEYPCHSAPANVGVSEGRWRKARHLLFFRKWERYFQNYLFVPSGIAPDYSGAIRLDGKLRGHYDFCYEKVATDGEIDAPAGDALNKCLTKKSQGRWDSERNCWQVLYTRRISIPLGINAIPLHPCCAAFLGESIEDEKIRVLWGTEEDVEEIRKHPLFCTISIAAS